MNNNNPAQEIRDLIKKERRSRNIDIGVNSFRTSLIGLGAAYLATRPIAMYLHFKLAKKYPEAINPRTKILDIKKLPKEEQQKLKKISRYLAAIQISSAAAGYASGVYKRRNTTNEKAARRLLDLMDKHVTGEKTKEDIDSIHRLNRFLVNPNRMSRRGSRLMGKLGLSQFEDELKNIRDKYQNNNPIN